MTLLIMLSFLQVLLRPPTLHCGYPKSQTFMLSLSYIKCPKMHLKTFLYCITQSNQVSFIFEEQAHFSGQRCQE